jgi:8-oxo-dGTP diphosphatase
MADIRYKNKNFNFVYRVSSIIYNKDKTKILLFYGNNSDYYMLPGGKVKELEESIEAIKREIYEELGFTNLNFKYIGISEEIIKEEKNFIHELTITYECIYDKDIFLDDFKSQESDWINFKWININEIDNYKIHPSKIRQFLNYENHHIIEKNI